MSGRCILVVACAACAAGASLFADVPWVWDDSARPAPSTSTGVRTVAQLESKGGGRGVSAAYGSASAPFESEILRLDECMEMLQTLRAQTEILLIPSFTASSLAAEDWIPSCQKLEAAGADGIQLDLFYMGNLIGTDGLSGRIVSLLWKLNDSLHIPVMPKININLPKDYIMPLLVEGGVQYVSLLDSVRSPYLRKTDGAYHISDRLDAETTSCFGHWQLPLTIGYTYTAVKHGLIVCAGGGITCADDVQKLLATGATMVQSATFRNRQTRHRIAPSSALMQ